MAESIWYEQVNAGLLEELKRSLTVHNAKGHLTPMTDKPKAFTIRKPEEDFKFEVFPCVSVYNLSSQYNPLRHLPLDVDAVMERDYENNQLVMEKQVVPFDLSYQIDFWSRFQTDMDDMLMSWLVSHYRQFNLPVITTEGTERDVNVLQVGEVVKSDLVLNKERLFHSIIKYSIWVEIDGGLRYTKPMVAKNGQTIRIQPTQ